MNTKLGILLGCLIAGSMAQAAPPGRGDGPPDGKRAERQQKMLEKFDADGDGALSDTEKETAKEAFQAKRAEHREKKMLKHFDEDGDGLLSDSEQAAAKEAHEKRLAKFDADGDGELSREEHKAAREAMKGKRGGKKGKGCDGDKGPPPDEA